MQKRIRLVGRSQIRQTCQYPLCRTGYLLMLIFSLYCCYSCSKSTAGMVHHQQNDQDNSHQPAILTDTASMGYMSEQKGTILDYIITSGDEAGATSKVTYTAVKDSAGYRLAQLAAEAAGIKIFSNVFHNQDDTYTLQTFPAIYYTTLSTLAASFTSFTHKETPLVMKLPHNDVLHTTVFPTTITASWHGVKNEEDTQMDTKMTQTEGEAVVDSIATVTTPAGRFKDCIRVHYLRTQNRTTTIHSSTDNFNIDDAAVFDIKIWYAKGIGPIKTVEFNLKTAVTTTTELSKIELPK